jgi:hypothetical protein
LLLTTPKRASEWPRLIEAIEAQGFTARVLRPRPDVQRGLRDLGFAGAEGVWSRAR